MFVVAIEFIRLNVIPLKCVSVSNQECNVRPTIMNINSNEPLFYSYSILVNKCSSSYNNVNDPYAKLCIPDVVNDMNINLYINYLHGNLQEYYLI